ncbi:MAG: Pyrrolo-quinoline quinone beta-propeller repeat protein [Myxococcales bacterium]|nr:Pyrrolo-quinoline quinone beta-propeller repeat protein [Myxococcales bacterium]
MKAATRLSIAAGLAASILALPAGAVVTSTWTVETYQQFDSGDATNAFITSTGELRPGWNTKRTAIEGDAVWSSLKLADGSVLLGSDANGAIFRVTGDSTKKLVSIPGAIAVVSLVQTSDGSVWAGAMPGNRLWKVDVGGGKATATATLKDAETIWALAATGNTVYAGTGPSGKLFAITGGTAKEVFDTEDKRVTALTVTTDGAIWMGTSERALVFRYDPKDGRTRAMADFAGNEVSSLAPYRDGVVAAANDLADAVVATGKTTAQVEAAEKPTAPKGQPAKAPDVGTKPGADKDPPPVTDLGRKGAKKGKGALFRIGSDGRLDQLHALTQTYFTAVTVTSDGAVYAGAADKGRVYMVDGDGSVATAFDVDERAVSQVWAEKAGLSFATDDTAAVYRTTGRADQARYVSDVLDAKAVSRFGKLTWIAQGKTKIETRSGNTAKPGVGWSEWQVPAQVGKLGGGNEGGKIASPSGRYLQFRVALEDDNARLRRVTSYYVPQNQATSVQDITVELATKESLPTLKDSAAKPRSPVMKISWKVENPDSDATMYTLEARRDGEANWRPISTGKVPLTATSWEWNTETYPDGWYRVRVTASDSAANSPDRALTSSQTTTMLAIDNTRPAIEKLTVTYPRAQARATDGLSAIAEMSYTVDDGQWQLGTTSDGLYDDLSEDLRIELPAGLARGTHTLAVRVADAAGNVGSTSTTFVIK